MPTTKQTEKAAEESRTQAQKDAMHEDADDRVPDNDTIRSKMAAEHASALALKDRQITDLKEELNLKAKQLQSLEAQSKGDIRRLTEIVEHLRDSHPGTLKPHPGTPESALQIVIDTFQQVAEGTSAADLRQKVHDVAAQLDAAGKARLRSLLSRLRGAAEAADQEGATISL